MSILTDWKVTNVFWLESKKWSFSYSQWNFKKIKVTISREIYKRI
jgi:hypothetical protein